MWMNINILKLFFILLIRVLVLDKGEIAEFDTPAALLSNTSSIFYGMAKDAGIL